LGQQAFINKRNCSVEKENNKECVVECGVVRIRNMVNDSSRQTEIRSHGNVDLEKDGEN